MNQILLADLAPMPQSSGIGEYLPEIGIVVAILIAVIALISFIIKNAKNNAPMEATVLRSTGEEKNDNSEEQE